MKKIILFTNMTSIQKHWENSLSSKYLTTHLSDFDAMLKFLSEHDEDFIIMLDELSVTDIDAALTSLEAFSKQNTLIFNSRPEVHHASTLLQRNIQGYENSYMAKDNLLKMIQSIESSQKWFFKDLTHFIINKYIQTVNESEPDFMRLLTQHEKEIALMIADGLSNKEIVQKKKIALSTVKGHIHHIFEKAGVSSRVELALKFK
ncbi:MAG: DNA-binding response regulator [Epsilonproteobacteria bacterium]|nr:MAG: DNA-binding response regulator [Campylobacterota bacterium]